MVKELSFNTIGLVVETWELAKQTPAFEEHAGFLILKRLFQLDPRTKLVFGFKKTDNFEMASLRLRMGALIHSKRMIHMFDQAMGMLGPDTELLTEMLRGLGKRHIAYGVKANYLPLMGVAIVTTLKELLQDKPGFVWSSAVEEAWNEAYEALSWDVMNAILNGEGKNLDELEDITLTSALRVL
eukprot:CAMPEP_0172440184 /NCGR_PEP_ID=MMETSP1065-20121228/906_1 /TAXON_ID=265537 /ORGANISM="Amphiprora paludosa, Strain CCMP125" /LENGTH=183 /DNA_ID=CAMNT_0013188969 /DNA_START=43 /DNA_END=594 /DNA_ORIENTATION=+